jgi:hypothetical protein
LFLSLPSLQLSGALLAFTALAFGHSSTPQTASGTLDPHATVNRGEMIEHIFFQLVNMVQILYLHLACDNPLWRERFGWCWLSSALWLIRGWFPLNSFSANYSAGTIDPKSTAVTRLMYRMKKWQYVLLKHCLQFGLNLSVALNGAPGLTQNVYFRLYWLLMSTSFVLEFFLQTLVKKKKLAQENLLRMQYILMSLATISSSVVVVGHVNLLLAALSLIFNFAHRKHDLLNTSVIMAGMAIYTLI